MRRAGGCERDPSPDVTVRRLDLLARYAGSASSGYRPAAAIEMGSTFFSAQAYPSLSDVDRLGDDVAPRKVQVALAAPNSRPPNTFNTFNRLTAAGAELTMAIAGQQRPFGANPIGPVGRQRREVSLATTGERRGTGRCGSIPE